MSLTPSKKKHHLSLKTRHCYTCVKILGADSLSLCKKSEQMAFSWNVCQLDNLKSGTTCIHPHSLIGLNSKMLCIGLQKVMLINFFGSPSSPRLCHSNCTNTSACCHFRNKVFNLFFWTIISNIRHDNIRVKTESWASTVHIHSGKEKEKIQTVDNTNRIM